MKLLILNGSPKGNESITLNYTKFIQKKFPNHEYEFENISQKINLIEKNESAFDEIITKVKNADAVIWTFPLYVFLVPAQYKRFIELIFERDAENAFKDKYTAVITTSIHFFDNTAHNYMRAICDDLQMKYAEFISAGMDSISHKKGQNELILFAENFYNAIENNLPTLKYYKPLQYSDFQYEPAKIINKTSARGKKILLLTDSTTPNGNLSKMTSAFKNNFNEEIEEINIHNLDIKSGCIGCIHCGYDNTCIFEGKDEFNEFFDSKLKSADIIVYAVDLKDRFLSARWKMFLDRCFFKNHAPQFENKQLLYLVSGAFSQTPNIREILEAWAQIQRGNIVDFVSDEVEDSAILDMNISAIVRKSIRYSEQNLKREDNFLGVGGMKIFRDDIYGALRFPFVADYKAYKKLGIFDSLKKSFKIKLLHSMMYLLIKIPSIRKKIYKSMMIPQMVKPSKNVVKKIKEGK